MFNYFNQICFNSKNLYNTTNFYVRQVMTAVKKDPDKLTENEEFVLKTINENIDKVNEIKVNNVNKKRLKENSKPIEEQVLIPDAKLYSVITKQNKYVNYELLDAIFKVTKNVDYLSLPSHSNQHIMKQVFQDWKSFYESIKDFKINPGKYTGKPKMPRYKKKKSRTITYFSNQTCTINADKYLKFPKMPGTKGNFKLNIGKLGLTNGTLQQIRVIPSKDSFDLEIVFKMNNKKAALSEEDPNRILGIDMGVNNFATIVNNIGERPIIVKGRMLKSINHYYNQKRAHYYGVLRQGKQPKKGSFYSNRLTRLDSKRNTRIKDFMHKVSFNIVKQAVAWNIDTIVVGKNENWKKDIKMRKTDKLNFTTIPFSLFTKLLTYKANEKGIRVIINEESYTSKASFLDGDEIPTYGKEKPAGGYKFSGKRVKRGVYLTKDKKHLLNADVNGGLNIIKKAVPNATWLWNKGCVFHPLVLSIA